MSLYNIISYDIYFDSVICFKSKLNKPLDKNKIAIIKYVKVRVVCKHKLKRGLKKKWTPSYVYCLTLVFKWSCMAFGNGYCGSADFSPLISYNIRTTMKLKCMICLTIKS